MAGRGTDILLGGNAEFLAAEELRDMGFDDELISEAQGLSDTSDESVLAIRNIYKEFKNKRSDLIKDKADEVKEAGGLFIIGTERHESRRIDNQLRGRSGRQGDVGESKFFLSLEDDLMRIFGGDRVSDLYNTFNLKESDPIESKMITNIIESSQKKIEGKNFNVRKNVLNYDDVLNKQREIIYNERNLLLDNEDISEHMKNIIREAIELSVDKYLPDDEVHDKWDLDGLRAEWENCFLSESDTLVEDNKFEDITREEIIQRLLNLAMTAYESKEAELGTDSMHNIERVVLLKTVDENWMNHLDDMDYLKKAIGLTQYGQKNPVVEYRVEGFKIFDDMIETIQRESVNRLFNAKVRQKAD